MIAKKQLDDSSFNQFSIAASVDKLVSSVLTKESTRRFVIICNRISAYISNDEHLHQGNTITVSYNGSIAEAFYQATKFWATDDVNVLYPKFALNRYIAMFLITLIHREKYRFNYGRKWDKELMESSLIKLPAVKIATNKYEPDWQFMEDYIKSLPYSSCL